MTDWGLPDWTDGAAYDPGSNWTDARWDWEFIRRTDEYRGDALGFLSQLEAGFEGEEQDEAWDRYWQRWGYSHVLDPCVSDHQQDDLLRWAHNGVRSTIGSPVEITELRNSIVPRSDEIAITLNLDKPIEPQIKIAKQAAKKGQVARHGKLIDPRSHRVKWKTYLRVLDGREGGASWNDLAVILTYSAKRHTTARDAYGAACGVRNSIAG